MPGQSEEILSPAAEDAGPEKLLYPLGVATPTIL